MAEPEITGTVNPRAIATLTGILGLRPDKPGEPACELRADGKSMIWRMQRGITVECTFTEGGGAHWHLDRDDTPIADEGGERRG